MVTDAGFKAAPAFASLVSALGGASGLIVYSGVHANPVEDDVRGAAQAFLKNDCDGIVAIGGSPLDAGKAARLLVKRPGFGLGGFYDEPDWSGLVAFIAIPTTAGTGSEVGEFVITLDATRRKAVLYRA